MHDFYDDESGDETLHIHRISLDIDVVSYQKLVEIFGDHDGIIRGIANGLHAKIKAHDSAKYQ